MPNSAHAPNISQALQDWLANCEFLVQIHNKFEADGGHMQFNLDLLNPEKLPEPLRSQAVEYYLDTK